MRILAKIGILTVIAAVFMFGMRLEGGGEVILGSGQESGVPGSPPPTDTSSFFEHFPFLRVHWSASPELSAVSALVADLENKEGYFTSRHHMERPIASLTKLMTAVLVWDHFDMKKHITLAASDFNAGSNASTNVLKTGDTYKASDLFSLLLIVSSNEAAEAFARLYGRDEFVAEMNRRAHAQQLFHTRFVDPSGISPENVSTVEDLKVFLSYVHEKYPAIFAVTRNAEFTAREEKSGEEKIFSSTHIFAGMPGFVGGKTGYLPEGGGNLASIFTVGTHPLLIVVLGSEDRFGDTSRLFSWFIHDFRPGS